MLIRLDLVERDRDACFQISLDLRRRPNPAANPGGHCLIDQRLGVLGEAVVQPQPPINQQPRRQVLDGLWLYSFLAPVTKGSDTSSSSSESTSSVATVALWSSGTAAPSA